MGLDDDETSPGDRVTEGKAVVGEGARVEDHPVHVAPCFVKSADELTFDVRLEVDDVDVELGGVSSEVGQDVVQRVAAVDLWLSCPEQVEVRSVEDEHRSSHRRSTLT